MGRHMGEVEILSWRVKGRVSGNNHTFSSHYSCVALCMYVCVLINYIRTLQKHTHLCSHVSLRITEKSHKCQMLTCDLGPPRFLLFLAVVAEISQLIMKWDGWYFPGDSGSWGMWLCCANYDCYFQSVQKGVISAAQMVPERLCTRWIWWGRLRTQGLCWQQRWKTRREFWQVDIRRSHFLQIAIVG